MATVKIDREAMARLLRDEHGPVGEDLYRRALRVEDAARRNVVSRRLRRSMRTDVTVDDRGLVATVGPRGRGSFFSFFVEFGTSKLPARPFLRPALGAAKRDR